MEDIAHRYGIQWTHVPFKGNADNMQALLGGHIDASADATGWGPHVDAGKMRLLATWGAKRTQALAERADAEGAGLRHRVDVAVRHRRARRAWTRRSRRSLHDAFKKGMEDPVHMQAMEKYDQDLIYMSSDDYAKFARETFAAEKATMARLAATQTPANSGGLARWCDSALLRAAP